MDDEGNCTRCNKLITEKDFDTSNFIITTIEGLQHKQCPEKQDVIHNTDVKEENKDDEKLLYDVDDESDDDEIQELMVTGTNQWQPIYEAWCHNEPIIKCIGQLRICFKEVNYGYSMNSVGTGTVFYVSSSHKAFIITAAHNIRHVVRYCIPCQKYMDKINMPRQQINNKRVVCCIDCNKPVIDKKYIKAKSIEFKRRSIHKHPYQDKNTGNTYHFGDTIITYDPVKCEFIGCGNLSEPGGDSFNCYQHCIRCEGGYDWAILSFDDHTRYYKDICKNIVIENGVKTMDWIKKNNKCFNIFGIPGKGGFKDQLVGMKSIDDKFDVKEHKHTHEQYLHQRVIDCEKGQSGSSLWIKDIKVDSYYLFSTTTNTYKLFGVHTGGRILNNIKTNVAVLFNEFAISNINKIISGKREPLPPSVILDGMTLNIKSNENDTIKRYKIRFRERDEDSKQDFNDEKQTEWCGDVIESSNNNIKYDMMAFIKERRLTPNTEYELQASVGNNDGYGSFSKIVSFITPDLNIIAPVLFEGITNVWKWMEKILKVKYDNLYDNIRKCNGGNLCELLNKIKNGTCNGFAKTNVFNKENMYKNIKIFVNGCRKLGIDERDCIEMNTFDNINQHNMVSIIINLYAVSIVCTTHKFGRPSIPICKQIKYKENDKSNADKYIGGVNKDGQRNGIGKVIWYSGTVCEGEWENGKLDGYCRYMFNDGNIYYGNYKDNKKNGYGKYMYKSGDIRQSYYKDNKTSGYGKYVWPSGELYTGNYENNKRNGYGKHTFPSGKSYEGEWKDNKYHGKGKELDKDGNIIWEGQYKNDSRCT